MEDLLGKILVAVITAVGSIIVCCITQAVTLKRDRLQRDEQHKKDLADVRKELSQQIAESNADTIAHFEELLATQATITSDLSMVQYKIEQLSRHVDVHNGVIDRMYKAEKEIAVLDECYEMTNKRLIKLES